MLRLLVAFWWAVGVLAPAAVATGPWDGQERRPTESVDDCLRVAASFVQIIGHDGHAIPHKKAKEDDLDVCQQTTTDNRKSCCTLPVERHLQVAAVDAMREIMASASQHLTDLLVINSQLYRNEFLKLMSLSNAATKLTLSSPSYKLPLREIEATVDALFLDLGRFMLRETNADIEVAVVEFFDAVFPAVLVYTINDAGGDGAVVPPAQRACFRAARRDLRPSPFADAVVRLTGDFDRSLGVVRLLLEAFDLALEVINATTTHALFEQDCSRALTRLLRCSYCAGLVEVRPCRSLCMNVVHGCLAHLADLNDRWNRFVDAVERVVLSMRGADDLQDYLGTFHFRISDSIMTAMETTHSYHSQIVSRCGPVARSPRPDGAPPPPTTTTGEGSPGVLRPPASTRGPGGTSSSSSSSGPSVRLHLKIEMFIRNLADSREFYRKLPDSLCSSEKLSAGNYDVCWNGTSLGAYTRPVPGQDFSIQVTDNPEMRVSDSRQTGLITIAEKLDNMTKILQSRVVPKLTSVQSDGRRTAHAHRTIETSGYGAVTSGDGSNGEDDDDDDDESGGSTAEPEDENIVTKKVKTGGTGGRKGVGGGEGAEEVEEEEEGGKGGGRAIAYVTSADFVFTEKSTVGAVRRVQSTTRPSPEVVARTSAGSTLYRNAGSPLLLLLLPLSTTLFSSTLILLRIVF